MNIPINDYVGYKIKLYPTNEQIAIFNNYFYFKVFVYNYGINTIDNYYKYAVQNNLKFKKLSFFKLVEIYTNLKNNDPNYFWLNSYNANTARIILNDVITAFNNFYNGRGGRPRYKILLPSNGSFPVNGDRLSITEDSVRIPSIGYVFTDKHNKPQIIGNGYKDTKNTIYKDYSNVRISFDGVNYWISFTIPSNYDTNNIPNCCNNFILNDDWNNKGYGDIIGVDIGCKGHNWIVCSNGIIQELPDTTKEKERIKIYQSRLNKKRSLHNYSDNYSNNEKDLLMKINKKYNRINNMKMNALNNLTSKLISLKPLAIVIEDLKESNMMIFDKDIDETYRNNHNKLIHESYIYNFKKNIIYKCQANNINIIIADINFPSSQLCSNCGYRQYIGTAEVYQCPNCGLIINRDMNAALNLKNYGYDIIEMKNGN